MNSRVLIYKKYIAILIPELDKICPDACTVKFDEDHFLFTIEKSELITIANAKEEVLYIPSLSPEEYFQYSLVQNIDLSILKPIQLYMNTLLRSDEFRDYENLRTAFFEIKY